jgi:NAD-dependent deacetylase
MKKPGLDQGIESDKIRVTFSGHHGMIGTNQYLEGEEGGKKMDAAYREEIEKFKAMIQESKKAVIFTGAGISTESGIPDFRSPGGLWTKMKPIDFSEFLASEEIRRESWRRRFNSESPIASAQPNAGHVAIAKLVQTGKVTAVITQNIDGLHHKSGVPEHQVVELHGNAGYAKCLDCEKRFEMEEVRKIFENQETLPVCNVCGGIIKTAVISFGQAMPLAEMQRAEHFSTDCDLFIAIGSSLVVYPAAGFPLLARRNGARLVIVNRDPTGMDHYADLVLNREIGPTLSAVVDLDGCMQ